MITSELVSYIKKQIENNISKDLIISKLIGVGWRREDIDEGFSSVELESKPEIYNIKIDTRVKPKEIVKEVINISPVIDKGRVIDKYHELLEGDSIFSIEKVSHKTEAPIEETPKVEVAAIETPIAEAPIVETPIVETPIVETHMTETPKVWTPMNVPVKEKLPTENVEQEVKKEITTQVEIQNLELQTGKEDKSSQSKEIKSFNKTSHLIKTKPIGKSEMFIPSLVPKSVVNSFGSINKNNLIKPENTINTNESPKNSFSNNLPQMAMLSSYSKDLLSINKAKEENVKQKNHKIIKWLIIVLVISAITLAIWAFVSGYINIKSLNISFIKKDPKVLLLNYSKVLSSLKSYKTETNIEISSPSFINITYGLISGEVIPSQDKDSFSINTLGIINQNEKGLFSDNFVTIKSSLLQDYITTDIKNNSVDLFISIPDLSQIIKDNAPKSSVVKINEQQFSLIPPLFSGNLETQLNKINLYKILSSGMSSYIDNETINAYNELISNVEITEKGQENIKGIDTYHYSINADRQLAKNLLGKISDKFVLNLSNDDKDRLTQILGSVTLDSFDVWIGKGDSNIYQYNVVLDIPLSKIVGFEDKSIGDNIVNINWKTTYYDFDVSNNIFMPDTSIAVTDFVNNIKEIKMKNDVSSFKQLAANLLKTESSYGKTSNTSGSCINPSSGSLFSPTGHTKNTATAVSSISLLLNKILGITGGAGFCYSTPKAWSFTIPISTNYDKSSLPVEGYTSFFCVDSTGSTKDLTASPLGVVCK